MHDEFPANSREAILATKPKRENYHSEEAFDEAWNYWMLRQGRVLGMTQTWEEKVHLEMQGVVQKYWDEGLDAQKVDELKKYYMSLQPEQLIELQLDPLSLTAEARSALNEVSQLRNMHIAEPDLAKPEGSRHSLLIPHMVGATLSIFGQKFALILFDGIGNAENAAIVSLLSALIVVAFYYAGFKLSKSLV